MSATKINCNFPNCTATFDNREDLHKHIDELKHQDTILVVVRNLAYAITTEELQKEFEPFKPREVRIATRKDGKSKGFALVFFDSEEDRTKAIEALNDKELAGRKIKVSNRRPRSAAAPAGTTPAAAAPASFVVYIGKFKEAPTEEALRGAFTDLAIEAVEIVADKLFAYVTFANEEDYKKALDTKTVLEANVEAKRGGRRKRLPRKPAAAAPATEATEKPKRAEKKAPRKPRAEKKETPAPAAAAAEEPKQPTFTKNTVHVGKLPTEVPREELTEQLKGLFAAMNPTSVKVISRKSHGRIPAITFGIVAFENEEDYKKALEVKKLGETEIVVDPKRAAPRRKRAAAAGAAAPRAPRAPAKTLKDTLFVGRLPDIITDEGLHEIFDGCNFKEAKIHEGKNSKYGVVVFANEEDAQKALDTVKGTSVEGKEIVVEFKRDIPEKKN